MSQDAELLSRYSESRSEHAFAELVRRHLNLVYFAALRRTGGNAHLAEDIAQDVFTALARQAATLTRHATLAGWLYTTTRFTAAKMLRNEQRRKRREQEAHVMSERSNESGITADWERLRPLLDEALDKLNDRDREVVLLRCLEGRAFAEIGATLSLTEDAARMRVERALEKLRTRLARHGVTSTASALGMALTNQAVATAPVGLAVSVTGAALSAGSAGAAVGGVIGFMSATKIMTAVAGAVIAAATAITWQQRQTNAALQAQIVELRRESGATATMAAENRRLRAEQSDRDNVAAAEHDELVQLRAEKEAFRKAIAARAAASRSAAEGDNGRKGPEGAPLAPGMVSVDKLANVGRATPTAAAQTMVWAMQRGDVKDVAGLLTFDAPERAKMEAFIATLPEQVRAEHGTPEEMIAFVMSGSPRPIAGVQLLSQTQPDADTEIHRVQVQFQGGEVRQDEVKFRRDMDGWKQVVAPTTVDRVIAYFKGKS